MANFVKVAAIGDVPPGTGKCVEAGGKQIALFNVGGAFHAIDNTCLHRGGPLGEGELDGMIVTCPWHGWQYDVTTGCNTMDESERVERYEVKVGGVAVWTHSGPGASAARSSSAGRFMSAAFGSGAGASRGRRCVPRAPRRSG